MLREEVHGILLLDKPQGITSNKILQRVKYLFNAKKAGHTGSLDPLATGMLPICFGEATKFSQFLLNADKTYEVVAQLGVRTATGDKEGEVIDRQSISHVNQSRLEQVMKQFLGESEQIPPMFSALKLNGKPLYELARQGIEVERKARRITLFSLDLICLNHDIFSFQVHCSKGTYIRSLVEDIGRQLGCGAHVVALRRIHFHHYRDATLYTFSELETLLRQRGMVGLQSCLLAMETSLQAFFGVDLSESQVRLLYQGQCVMLDHMFDYVNHCGLVKLMHGSKFVGIGEILSDGRLKPKRLLSCVGYIL